MRKIALVLAILVVGLASVLGYTLAKPEPVVREARAAEVALSTLSAVVEAAPDEAPAEFPLAITDDMNRSVTIAEVPQRIVSIAPSCTEILFAVGAGDMVVGRDDFSDYPEEAKQVPVVTSYFTGTDPEEIINATPDLVLSDGYAPIGEKLQELGLTMVVLQAKDIAGILNNIALVGKICGKDAEARQLIDEMKARVGEIVTKTAGAERPWVFYEIDATGQALTAPWTAGSGTFVDALIALAGGENVVSTSGWPQFSLEKLIEADPDMIILGDYPYVSPEDVKDRTGAWQQLTAVKEGKVYAIIDPSLTSRPGPRIIDGLEEMARMIHPELFE